MKKNREYYDRFASAYDQRRDHGYHALLDELESDLVRKKIRGKLVLDAGCGTGLISRRLEDNHPVIVGVDLSFNMLEQARERGQHVIQSDLANLPFRDETFDGLFSLKVLAHIPPLKETLKELGRVVKTGGVLVLEFYNPVSLRGVKKSFRIRHKVASGTDETEVYNAFHGLEAIKKILPDGLEVESVRGIMIVTPLVVFHRIPVIGSLLGFLERRFCDGILKYFGGFLDVVVKKLETS